MNAQQADGDDGDGGAPANLQGEVEMTGDGGAPATCNLLQGDEEAKEEEAVKDTLWHRHAQ